RDMAHGRLTVQNHQAEAAAQVRSGAVHELVIPNYVVSILRPHDLLAVRLEYYGFDLQVGGGNPPVLVENLSPGQNNPYMVAHFGPQNIAEQAYFEAQPSGGASNPKPDPGDGGSQKPD